MPETASPVAQQTHVAVDPLTDGASGSVTPARWRFVELLAFLSVVVIIALNGYLAFRTIDDLSERHRSITNTGNIIVKLKDLNFAILAAESGQRGYLLTDDDVYLSPYNQALSILNERMVAVALISTEIPGQQERLDLLLSVVKSKFDEMQQTIVLQNLRKKRQALELVNEGTGRVFSEEIATLMNQLEAQEFALQSRLYRELSEAEQDARILVAVFFFMCIVLLAGAYVAQRKRLGSERDHLQELAQRAHQLEDEVAQRTQELQLYSDELSRSNRELEDFAFVASHDLQEPLRKVRAFSSRIKKLYEDKLDEKGIDYLGRMDKAAERMSALIQDLLSFSRIKTRGKEFAEVDLNQVLEAVVDDLEFAIENSGAKITSEPLPNIEADVSQMNQLFLNLLSNAMKFRRPDTKPVIHVNYEKITENADGVELEYHKLGVKDNGIGFDQEYRDKIFLPFQRLHAREEYEGTGIGLAVCRRIVERHGGRLEAFSAPDEGTEFVIILPVVVIDLSQV